VDADDGRELARHCGPVFSAKRLGRNVPWTLLVVVVLARLLLLVGCRVLLGLDVPWTLLVVFPPFVVRAHRALLCA
jgi:hypothetical protein